MRLPAPGEMDFAAAPSFSPGESAPRTRREQMRRDSNRSVIHIGGEGDAAFASTQRLPASSTSGRGVARKSGKARDWLAKLAQTSRKAARPPFHGRRALEYRQGSSARNA